MVTSLVLLLFFENKVGVLIVTFKPEKSKFSKKSIEKHWKILSKVKQVGNTLLKVNFFWPGVERTVSDSKKRCHLRKKLMGFSNFKDSMLLTTQLNPISYQVSTWRLMIEVEITLRSN